MSFTSTQISVPILCPTCAAQGMLLWDRSDTDVQLISISSSFYERLGRKAPYPIELVCHGCGTAQAESQHVKFLRAAAPLLKTG